MYLFRFIFELILFFTIEAFGQPQQQPATSLFGQTNNAQANTSLFGQPSTSGFGAAKQPGFGFTGGQPTSLFAQPATSTANTGFGTTFGNTATSAFGQSQVATGANGTAIAKYQPHAGTDTLVKNGQTNSVNTRQHCITAMKEYESKCLEELRIEDYMANRKGPQAGAAPPLFGTNTSATGLFGAPSSQPQSTGLFGQQPPNTLGGFGAQNTAFGQPSAFGQAQPAPSNMFGKPNNTFGQATTGFGQPQAAAGGLFGKSFTTPATSANTGFTGFGNTTANATNPFGAKPFGQPAAGGIFGQTQAPAAGSTFGQPSAFGGFGTAAPTATSQPAPLFGPTTNTGGTLFGGGLTSSAPNTAFGGFGTVTNTAAGGLFGQKPSTGFGTPSAFGAPTSSAASGFGLGNFGTATTTGFGSFGQSNTFKPAATGFTGFGTQSAAPQLGGGLGLGSNLAGL